MAVKLRVTLGCCFIDGGIETTIALGAQKYRFNATAADVDAQS